VTPEMVDRIGEAGLDAQDDPNIRVVVITGTGRGFCTGFDIGVFRAMDLTAIWDIADRMITAWSLIRTLSIPTIAALNGVTAGGRFRAGTRV